MEEIEDKKSLFQSVSGPDAEPALKRAARVLESGGTVAFPTESFYGLGVSIMNDTAINRLFSIKGRDKNNPLLILVPDRLCLEKYVTEIPDIAAKLMDEYWPGGLTLVFRASKIISPLLTAGTRKIAVRLSSHKIATGLAKALGHPITGTSANRSGEPACVNADEIYKTLGKGVDLILDGGKTAGGKGSTIVDVTGDLPVIIREGMVSIRLP